MNKKKKRNIDGFMTFVSKEIQIEYKACLYFFAILFYYCVYRLFQQTYVADMLHMTEIILCTYVIGYIQVYGMGDFDDSDRLGKKEIIGTVLCTAVYTLLSYVCGWFEQNTLATVLFVVFLLFTYLCVFIINRIRRIWDTQSLNTMLTAYKKGNEKDEASD